MALPTDHAFFLVIDLEATCADDGSVPAGETEIIEIGAVMWNACLLDAVSEFQSFVRPVRHPRLTPFCSHLTHIRQADVEPAPTFPETLDRLRAWMNAFDDFVFCSWGTYDRQQFLQDCRFHGVPYPFGDEHLNLKAILADQLGRKKAVGLHTAMRHLGLTFQGQPHRGIDDARNVGRVLRWLATGGWLH